MVLSGKRALVTGSTSGIGAGIAEQLAKAGCDIILHGLGDPDEIEAFRLRLAGDYNVKVEFTEGNLATEEGALQMLKNAGKIDILVNNAGVQHVSAVEDMPLEKWNFVMAINLTSAFIAIKESIPYMYEQGWGRIVNVASAHGKVASMNKAPYVASKHGLLGMSKVVALEAAAKGGGVTSNCICPGWVLTPLVQKQIEARAEASGTTVEDETVALCGEKHPNKKFTTPQQIGDAVVFLCSPAGDNITGTEISMDGGWTAQ